MTDDLIGFLRARLDEDERTAQAAKGTDTGRWFVGDKWNVYDAGDSTPWDDVETNELIVYGNTLDYSEHIARHDPARVLAEVAAKRQVISDELDRALDAGETDDRLNRSPIIRLLASPYRDHPDYRQEWTP